MAPASATTVTSGPGEAGSIGYDVGAIYYWYSEEEEGGASPDPSNNTIELYGSIPDRIGA